MNRSFWDKYLLVIFLSFIATGLIVVKLTYQPNEEIPAGDILLPLPTPTETIQEEVNPVEKETGDLSNVEKEVDPDYPLWQSLPYYGKGFIIDRYIKPLTLAVKTKGLDKSIAEKEVVGWLEEEGFNADSHQLVWEN